MLATFSLIFMLRVVSSFHHQFIKLKNQKLFRVGTAFDFIGTFFQC